MRSDLEGVTYLLHFSEPLGRSQHYMGWTNNLPERLRSHLETGTRERCVLTWEVRQRGIVMEVVRVWPGTIQLERALKRRKNHPKLCPVCNPRLQDYVDPAPFLIPCAAGRPREPI